MSLTKGAGASYQAGRGFSLVELLIIVAIISILAGMAYPSYTDYMRKSRRSDGKTLLTGIAARQEQYYLDNKSYTSNLSLLGYPVNADGSVSSEKSYYSVLVTASTATTYTLAATAQGVQASDICPLLTLDEEGTKGVTDPIDTTTAAVVELIGRCW